MPAIAIRRAAPADAAVLAALGRDTFVEAFGPCYRPEDLSAFLTRTYRPELEAAALATPGTRLFLAEDGGNPVGYAKLGPCKLPVDPLPPGAMELHRLYVRAAYHGRRVGSALMEAALAAVPPGAPVYLGVWENNPGAQRFYARYGFRPVGNYHFYVGEQADREIIMLR